MSTSSKVGLVPSEDPVPGYQVSVFSLCLHMVFPFVCVWAHISSPYKNISYMGLRTSLTNSFYLNYMLKALSANTVTL